MLVSQGEAYASMTFSSDHDIGSKMVRSGTAPQPMWTRETLLTMERTRPPVTRACPPPQAPKARPSTLVPRRHPCVADARRAHLALRRDVPAPVAPIGTSPAAALRHAGDGVYVEASTRGCALSNAPPVTAPPPPGGRRLGAVYGATSASDLALLVKQVRQRRRFEPDIGISADPLGCEGQHIAVEVPHERADGHFQLVGVAHAGP
jgi:hypothetical protein